MRGGGNFQFPVRISGFWCDGYGYASSIFYGDFFLYFPAFLRILGLSPQSAYKMYLLGVNIFTFLTTYYCLKKICGERLSAFVGTAAYMLVPYRLLDLYLRAAVGEYTAMVFLPMVIYGLSLIYGKQKETGNRGWLWLALGFSGLIQCHVISTFIVGLFTFFVCVIKMRETFDKEVLLQFVKAVVCTVLMNLWFLLPFLDYMQFDYRMSEPWMRFTAHGVFFSQLISFFPHGEGASIATGKLWDTDSGIEMPYTLGGGVMLALVLCIAFAIYYRKEKKNTYDRKRILMYTGFCVLSLYMSTIWFPWDFLQQKSSLAAWIIGNIQYPWRFLTVSSITGAFAAAFLVNGLRGRFQQAAVVSMGILLLSSAVFFMEDYARCAEKRDIAHNGVSSWWVGRAEYMPAGVDKTTFGEEDNLFQNGSGIAIQNYEKGEGTVAVTCVNTRETETYIDVPILYYKGYFAKDTKTKEQLTVMPADNERIRVMIPARYQGTFAVAFESPWYWRVSEAVSFAFIIGIVVFLHKKDWKKGQEKKGQGKKGWKKLWIR